MSVAEMPMRELVDDVNVHGVLLMTFTESRCVRSALRRGSTWCVAAIDVVLGLMMTWRRGWSEGDCTCGVLCVFLPPGSGAWGHARC